MKHDSFYFCAGMAFELSPFLFQSKESTQIAPVPPLLPLSGGDSPHLHSMEELLLNPHYNQKKCSPDRYMMLNRDRDRERAAPLLSRRDKSTHMNGANSHVLSSLVWFREPPSPRPWLVFWKPSSWIFFRMPGLSTFIIIKISSGLYKTEWKARGKAQTKGERKSRKGGRSLVLVFTDDTSLSNFHFWVLWIERKKKLPFLSFFYPFDEFRLWPMPH